jgi:glycine/D-amino acid oxidase-like deaminating enzyme/nitrite reductase/ring-hydroxylating ferredoxin subunit
MKTLSVWRSTAAEAPGPMLDADTRVDVAIVGGGITGVTLAMLLAEEGRSVVLLEAGTVGSGTTGNSTGNLYETLSTGLHAVREKWGDEVCRQVVRSRREALDFIAHHGTQLDADCHYRRCALYRYASAADAEDALDREHEASVAAGLTMRLEGRLPDGVPQPHGLALVLEDQAQFHPLIYTQALARRAAAAGCRILERTAALEIDAGGKWVRSERATVRAGEIVLATHTPSGVHAVQTEMLPHQEYGLAFRGTHRLAPGIYWGMGRQTLSVRGIDTDEGDYVVCVGGEHKTAQHDALQALADLEALARERLGLQQPAWRWSAQNFRTADGLPYIGRDGSGALIATGFGTDGLVYGTLAATLLEDEILGRDNRWKALYKASRFEPVKAAKGFVQETAGVARAMVGDRLRDGERFTSLAPGAGALVEIDGDKVAAYRDASGALQLLSPVCTHLKCQVRWNALETTWDCPCHGSRYAPDGHVIEGPALQPLQPLDRSSPG